MNLCNPARTSSSPILSLPLELGYVSYIWKRKFTSSGLGVGASDIVTFKQEQTHVVVNRFSPVGIGGILGKISDGSCFIPKKDVIHSRYMIRDNRICQLEISVHSQTLYYTASLRIDDITLHFFIIIYATLSILRNICFVAMYSILGTLISVLCPGSGPECPSRTEYSSDQEQTPVRWS
jgi:hypothetical protein